MVKIVKEVKVKAKVIKATTKTVETIICDIKECGKKVVRENYGGGGGRCQLCARDVCKDHVELHDDGSDYWDKYCYICYELYIPARRALDAKQEKEDEALTRRIKKESLSTL